MRKYSSIVVWLIVMLWLGVASAFGADSGAVIDPRPGVIVIGDDDGGVIDAHMKFYNRIHQSGVPVRVEGMCVSACTLVLSLPHDQVCMAQTASFGFHLASSGDKPLPDFTAMLIVRYYPKPIIAWLVDWVKHNGKLTVDRISYMSSAEVVASGVFPACGD